MRKMIIIAGLAAALVGSVNAQDLTSPKDNPLLAPSFGTPFEVPPFEKIKVTDYLPAFILAMQQDSADVAAICNNTAEPTFENTIVALDQSGDLLRKVGSIFGAQSSANTNEEMQEVGRKLSPLRSKHYDDINLNPTLFARIKAVYDKRASLNLNKEQAKLLEETYKSFVRSGANLPADKQARLRELNSQISMLQLTFSQNMLKETNVFKLVIDNKEDLAGLPEDLVANAAITAKQNKLDGKWVFTLKNPSIMPFLQYSAKRDLRKKILEAYLMRGNNGNANDNKEVVLKLIQARLEKAKLMGYPTYAAYALDDRMAKTADNVYQLLDEVWKPAVAKAQEELADINAEIKKEGGNFEAEAWDWRYYADKAKQSKFSLNENEVRPYLELDKVREGVFYVANKLYGITFTPIKNIPLPHPDALAFECKDKDGSHLGVLYMDHFPRAGKNGGAWCGTYRSMTYKDGKKVAPVVTIVTNFTPPAPGQPALLSVDEATTLFHEFGHALHNLFKDVHYYGVSGVPRDFVELPSQIDEHWAFEPEVLKVYARNYKTGEVIPASLIEKLDKSGKYGQGFATVEYVAASYLDMDYHVLTDIPDNLDINKFEAETLAKRGILSQIPPRYRTTYFSHTMGGGYTAGYYSYMWAEVLDADAYEAYKETGDIFNQEVAGKFRKYILTPGGIDDAMDMYINFRGRKPDTKPLLRNRGLIQ